MARHQQQKRRAVDDGSAEHKRVKLEPDTDSIVETAPSARMANQEVASEAEKQLFANGIITLKAGPAAATITIHEQNLRRSSSYLRDELDRMHDEGDSSAISFPNQSEQCVAGYVNWLYSAVLPCYVQYNHYGLPDHGLGGLVEAYVLAEEIEDDTYCNAVFTAMTTVVDRGISPDASHVRSLYRATRKHAPIRDFLASLYVDRGRDHLIAAVSQGLPYPFLLDLSVKYSSRQSWISNCSYFSVRGYWLKQTLG